MGALFATALAGQLSPAPLLLLCFWIGSANAMFGPVWQSSVGEQVPTADLPQGIALNSVSYNIARSFGPAVGRLLVALWGPVAAFGGNALCSLPVLGAQLAWRRTPEPPRLPPEHVRAAILSGEPFVPKGLSRTPARASSTRRSTRPSAGRSRRPSPPTCSSGRAFARAPSHRSPSYGCVRTAGASSCTISSGDADHIQALIADREAQPRDDFVSDLVRARTTDRALSFPLSGLDERVNPDPITSDPARKGARYVDFGSGPHTCLGALLARREVGIFVEEWVVAMPEFRIAEGTTPRMASGIDARSASGVGRLSGGA